MNDAKTLLEQFPSCTRTGKRFELKLQEEADPVSFGFEPARVAARRFAQVMDLLSSARECGLIEVTLLPRADSAMAVCVAPGSNCGFVTVRHGEWKFAVEVTPKIAGTNLFALLSMEGDPSRFLRLHEATFSTKPNQSLVGLLADAYAGSLRALVQRAGLRGLHETRQERLPFRVRGQIDVGAYLREFAAGRPFIVPARFATHTVDNRVNRLLRWALHSLILACRETGNSVRELENLDNVFAGVVLERASLSTLREIFRLPASFDHYRQTGAIALAEMIVRGLRFDSEIGDVPGAAVAVPMHEVFEAAFARVVASFANAQIDQIRQQEWPIVASRDNNEKSGTFIPDVVLPPTSGRSGLVADTKWKSGLNAAATGGADLVLNIPGIKLYNADIFQLLSYLEAARAIYKAAFVGALVYPVADVSEADLAPVQLKVGGAAQGLPLFLVPWDIGKKCLSRVELTWGHLEKLRGEFEKSTAPTALSVPAAPVPV